MRLNVLEKPWYGDGLRFTCTQCGNCCTGPPGFVWISDTEVARLAEYLKISVKETIEKYCRRISGRLSLKEHRNPASKEYDCIFLREEGSTRTCYIYPVRPLQCRTWPFWPGNLASEKSWTHAAQRCPGMTHGRKFTAAQAEAIRDSTDWP
jgi:Fe-S-cluster containining protein